MADKKAKGGHASTYTEEMADRICYRIASGQSVSEIAADIRMPSHETIYKWRRDFPQFAEKLARAREDRNEAYADQMRAIGNRVMTEPHLDPQRARAAIDAIDKAARLMNPKTSKIEIAGPNGGAIRSETKVTLDDETIGAIERRILGDT